jgi:threonylcarbamoyladenosine tRNA methylthiotransferase MtaB
LSSRSATENLQESRKVYLATFGCRTNQADTFAIREDLLAEGCEEVDCWSEADIIVINSCTVTHRSDQQVRQLTRKFRRENPRARIVVTGCYAQRSPDSLARIPGVDAVVGNTRKANLAAIALETPAGLAGYGDDLGRIYRDEFADLREIGSLPAGSPGGRTRPLVKIQDGCDARCSYCIVPRVRGPGRSVVPRLVLEQVRHLVKEGFREIVFTGIHIGTYGMHLRPRHPLDRLLSEVLQIPGLERLRISSIEPMELSRRIIELAAGSGKIAPHFHICLQSGSNRLLRMMRRPYSTAKFASIMELIRKRLPEAGIGTDLIVGFPGETEQDHCETVRFVEEMPFTYFHVFPYSDRPGTAASQMPEKVERADQKRRGKELRSLSNRKNQAFRRSFLGRELAVLTLTEEKEGHRVALSGNYIRALVDASLPANEIIQARARAESGEHLILEQ